MLGGNTTIKETLTVADGKETTLGGPVTIKGDSTFEQSAIFTDLTTDPDPSTGKLYRKGNDLYFNGEKLLTDGEGGKWSDVSSQVIKYDGKILYSNVWTELNDLPDASVYHGMFAHVHNTGGAYFSHGGNWIRLLADGEGDGKWSDGTTAGQIHYSGGNVGIGTTTPNEALHVNGNIQLNNWVRSMGDMIISADFDNNNNDSSIRFNIDGNNLANEKMRIASDGNVGIGTDNPGSVLEIKGHSDPFSIYNASGEQKLRVFTASNGSVLALTDGGQDIIRLDGRVSTPNHSYFNAGNVGIGITTPTAKLHVSRIDQHETDSALTVIRGDTSSGDRPTAPIFNVFNGESGGTEVFRVQGNGNVGIGANDPAGPLHIEDSDAHSICLTRKLDITNNSNGAAAKIRGGALVGTSDSYGGAVGFSLYDTTANGSSTGGYLYFETKNEGASLSEKLRITNKGKIGINQPAPTYYIDAKPSNQSDQFVARFTTEHDTNMMHSGLIFSKTKQNGTATSDGAIMGSLGWEGKDTANTVRSCGMIKVVQRGAAGVNGRVADMYLHAPDGNLYNNASISNDPKHEKLRLKGGGGVILARLDSAPSNPDAGEMYFNTTNNTFYGYNGTSWKALHS